jgi:histidyl-tRNA synthetase
VTDSVALVYDPDVTAAVLARLKTDLMSTGARVTLAARARNSKQQLDQLAAQGYSRFAFVTDAVRAATDLELRAISAG